MTLKTRRILYSLFIVIFFVAAPPLVLYTAGYRYDFQYNRIVETGSLVVKSRPENASIFLNGVLHSETTPTIINTILPGKINLLLELEGYHSWKKVIEIRPRVTTFEENVTLFAQTTPRTFAQEKAVKFWWNSSSDKVVYTTPNGSLRLYNTLNQQDTLIANLGRGLIELAWSQQESKFFFGRTTLLGKKEFIVVDTQSLERIIAISSATSQELTNLQWDPRARSSLYGLNKSKELVRINYLLRTEQVITQGPIENYLVEEERIILLTKRAAGKPYLAWIHPRDSSTIHLLPGVLISAADELIASNAHYITFRRAHTNEFIVVDPSIQTHFANEAVAEIPKTTDIIWSNDGNTLIYSDGFGIYTKLFTTPISVLPRVQDASSLVTRYSKPLRELAITQDGRHVFYIVGGELRVSELNSANDPRSITLLEESENSRGIQYLERYNALSFVDGENNLVLLPLSLENTGAGFLGSE